MIFLEHNKQLILFDGVCNLCNNTIKFIIKRDKNNRFLFAPLQGKIGQKIIKTHNIDTTKVDSILLYKDNTVFHKSTAALTIFKQLNFPTNVLALFFIIPKFIRDWGYSVIAKNRYSWFGKQDKCMVPTAELKKKFLE